jgi:hypothetical protein
VTTCWLMRTRRCTENRATLAYLLDAPHPIVKTRRGRSGIESYKLRRFATSADSGNSVSISAMNSPMNIESYKRPMPLARWCVLLALLSATVSPTPSFSQGTPEQRLACTPHVLRLCSAFIPDADRITICLRERSAELSDACRTALEAGLTQSPGVSDGNGTRKRTAR